MPAPDDLPERVRATCAAVARRSRLVRVDDARLDQFTATLAAEGLPAEALGSSDADLAFAFVMNAVHFGSGWFPVVRKRPGMSGATTMEANLREHWSATSPWTPDDLVRLDVATVADVFGQDPDGATGDLMRLFIQALHDLGAFVRAHGGTYDAVVDAAGGSAVRLAELLTEMPLYRDVSTYRGEPVAFYKRAQLTAATIGGLDDLDRLTIFADNLVPHVLRVEGVLVYDAALAARIDREELLPHGSPAEVEIRACAVTACERLAAALGVRAALLDLVLWNRGQQPRYKAVPRHRTRCPYY